MARYIAGKKPEAEKLKKLVGKNSEPVSSASAEEEEETPEDIRAKSIKRVLKFLRPQMPS